MEVGGQEVVSDGGCYIAVLQAGWLACLQLLNVCCAAEVLPGCHTFHTTALALHARWLSRVFGMHSLLTVLW